MQAGIHHPHCQGIAALTNDDHANLAVAVAVKLINPELKVLCRAEHGETAANMASFGTDHIINPYELFGDHLAMAIHALGTYLLHEWLTGVPGTALPSPTPPPVGHWVVCGYGRFGKAVVRNLTQEGATLRIVEAEPEKTNCPEYIRGTGTEAQTLLEAGIAQAVGIVAGTDNDINNLSIAMTALEQKSDLFVVIRKNRRFNEPLFRQFNADITMQLSDIIAHECLAHLVTPMLAQFLQLARSQSNAWANTLISRLVETVGENVPETWGAYITPERAPAVMQLIRQHKAVTLRLLTRDPFDRDRPLFLMPLLLLRDNQPLLLPDLDTPLQPDDRILFCGTHTAKAAHPLLVLNLKVLNYVRVGTETPDGLLWRWLTVRRQKKARHKTP
jgi:Trk K+ transport system NAD-binding subunit